MSGPHPLQEVLGHLVETADNARFEHIVLLSRTQLLQLLSRPGPTRHDPIIEPEPDNVLSYLVEPGATPRRHRDGGAARSFGRAVRACWTFGGYGLSPSVSWSTSRPKPPLSRPKSVLPCWSQRSLIRQAAKIPTMANPEHLKLVKQGAASIAVGETEPKDFDGTLLLFEVQPPADTNRRA